MNSCLTHSGCVWNSHPRNFRDSRVSAWSASSAAKVSATVERYSAAERFSAALVPVNVITSPSARFCRRCCRRTFLAGALVGCAAAFFLLLRRPAVLGARDWPLPPPIRCDRLPVLARCRCGLVTSSGGDTLVIERLYVGRPGGVRRYGFAGRSFSRFGAGPAVVFLVEPVRRRIPVFTVANVTLIVVLLDLVMLGAALLVLVVEYRGSVLGSGDSRSTNGKHQAQQNQKS